MILVFTFERFESLAQFWHEIVLEFRYLWQNQPQHVPLMQGKTRDTFFCENVKQRK